MRRDGQTAVTSHRADVQPLFGRSIERSYTHTQRCGVSEEPYHSAESERTYESASASYRVPKFH